MDDEVRALLEILTERLGATKIIFDKKSAEPIDYYVVEETMNNNLNFKRAVLRKRRDIMQLMKA